MSEALERLRAAKVRADSSVDDVVQLERYIADRLDAGWTDTDADEYRSAVAKLLRSGTEEERIAAREFWSAALATWPAVGINQRIRSTQCKMI